MCVSYRGLNKVTKLYKYPIPRCDMAVTIFQMGSSTMWIITVNAKQDYHQVMVRECDIDNLAFFSPNHKTYAFKVMKFGPINASAFYNYMMGNFKFEWDALFIKIMTKLATLGSKLGGDLLHAMRV